MKLVWKFESIKNIGWGRSKTTAKFFFFLQGLSYLTFCLRFTLFHFDMARRVIQHLLMHRLKKCVYMYAHGSSTYYPIIILLQISYTHMVPTDFAGRKFTKYCTLIC